MPLFIYLFIERNSNGCVKFKLNSHSIEFGLKVENSGPPSSTIASFEQTATVCQTESKGSRIRQTSNCCLGLATQHESLQLESPGQFVISSSCIYFYLFISLILRETVIVFLDFSSFPITIMKKQLSHLNLSESRALMAIFGTSDL